MLTCAREMRLTTLFVAVVLVGCEKPPPRITTGPFTGYDFDVQGTDREKVDDAGVYAVERRFRRSRVGSSTEYFTVAWDLENSSDFWFCVRVKVRSKMSDVTTWGDGIAVLAPHSVNTFAAGIGANSSSTGRLSFTFEPRAWPADREGSCGSH